mmetsp:Transcript_29741/g.70710  ORF Transcript_29741/g.70710 Transcript_29741/m.70710 type:complete len:214 (-) Transcript_29741:105-746(-)
MLHKIEHSHDKCNTPDEHVGCCQRLLIGSMAMPFVCMTLFSVAMSTVSVSPMPGGVPVSMSVIGMLMALLCMRCLGLVGRLLVFCVPIMSSFLAMRYVAVFMLRMIIVLVCVLLAVFLAMTVVCRALAFNCVFWLCLSIVMALMPITTVIFMLFDGACRLLGFMLSLRLVRRRCLVLRRINDAHDHAILRVLNIFDFQLFLHSSHRDVSFGAV